MVSERFRDRGQLILVSAIAIAFIILGVVVVFNGLLYTQTVSTSGTSSETAHASTAEIEIERGVACYIYKAEDLEGGEEGEIEEFAILYQESTANSNAAAVDIHDIGENDVDTENNEVTVTFTYKSNEVDVEKTLEDISAEECPLHDGGGS